MVNGNWLGCDEWIIISHVSQMGASRTAGIITFAAQELDLKYTGGGKPQTWRDNTSTDNTVCRHYWNDASVVVSHVADTTKWECGQWWFWCCCACSISVDLTPARGPEIWASLVKPLWNLLLHPQCLHQQKCEQGRFDQQDRSLGLMCTSGRGQGLHGRLWNGGSRWSCRARQGGMTRSVCSEWWPLGQCSTAWLYGLSQSQCLSSRQEWGLLVGNWSLESYLILPLELLNQFEAALKYVGMDRCEIVFTSLKLADVHR